MYPTFLRSWLGQSAAAPRKTPPRRRPARRRLSLETLEDRTLPSSYTAGTVADLVADINAANKAGGSNTITLVAGTTFTLAAVNNTTDGATGLPVIAAKDTLTIVGNGDTIQRSTASGTPAFRLFDVAGGASLILKSLTVQNGLAQGDGSGAASAEGGAIYSQGTLTLNTVTVQNNTAQGYSDGNAAGGGIYSGGSLTVQSSTIQNNQALGGAGLAAFYFDFPGDPGGSAFGGGLYISGGTATLTSVNVSSNTARGGDGGMGGCVSNSGIERNTPGGAGGNGLGGGLYVAAGTIDLHNDTVSGNTAAGGAGGQAGHCGTKGHRASNGSAGLGEGGGLYIDAAAAVCLDAFTQSHVQKNHASTSNPDIYGTYTTCP